MKKFQIINLAVLLLIINPFRGIAQYLPENSTYWVFGTQDGAQHYVAEIGTNENPDKTFVLLHGGYGKEHSGFIDMVLPFANEFRFVLYDQRGSLRSPAPDSTITVDVFAKDLEIIRKQLNVEKLQIIGHSMGALIALDYLEAFPDRVKSLTLLGAPPDFAHQSVFGDLSHLSEKTGPLRDEIHAFQEANKDAKLKELQLDNLEGLTARQRFQAARIYRSYNDLYNIDNWQKPAVAFYNPKVIEVLNKHTQYEGWMERQEKISRAVTSIDVPIRVINGKQDYIGGFDICWPVLMEKMSDAKLYLIDKACHLPWIDQPDEFNSIFLEVLRESAALKGLEKDE